MTATTSNQQIREDIRTKRRLLNTATKNAAATAAYLNLCKHPVFLNSNSIGFYLAEEGELNPAPLLSEALKQNKKVYLPSLHKTKDREIIFSRYMQGDKLEKNRHGIEQPGEFSGIIAPWELDLVIVPCVAVDKQGNRLGRGAGFYDRCFSFVFELPDSPRPILVGYAYEMQQVSNLKKEAWDVPMDYIVSEKQIFQIKK